MLYHIDTEERRAGNVSGTVYTLSHPTTGSFIDVWPSHGFNCLRWVHHGKDRLYSAPDWLTNPVPTRSGIPILYPFPNRIREGKFSYNGNDYSLPKNDSTHANAIHGFAPRKEWTVSGYGTDTEGAWLHADFRIAQNAPESSKNWPGDALLSVVYRFSGSAIRIKFRVFNDRPTVFPFGIGLHPYFRIPGFDQIDLAELHAPARSIWPLTDNLPTGPKQPVPDDQNWNRPKRITSHVLDAVYGDLGVIRTGHDGLLLRATLKDADADDQLEVWTTEHFRESVLFTPAHRQALCIEPYTCVTDAINHRSPTDDSGWIELAPNHEWNGLVEFKWAPAN